MSHCNLPDLTDIYHSETLQGVFTFVVSAVVFIWYGPVRDKVRCRFAVVGHDFGASLAWRIASHVPARVSKLVALSVGHPGAVWGAGLPVPFCLAYSRPCKAVSLCTSSVATLTLQPNELHHALCHTTDSLGATLEKLHCVCPTLSSDMHQAHVLTHEQISHSLQCRWPTTAQGILVLSVLPVARGRGTLASK